MNVLCILLPLFVSASPELSEPIERKSLSPDAKYAWQQPGFRVFLGYHGGIGSGLNTGLFNEVHEVEIDTGVRLSPHWALMLQLRYGAASMTDDSASYSGLSYAGIVRAEYHFHTGTFLGMGLGFAGLSINDANGFYDIQEYRDIEDTYTLPNADSLILGCAGTGLATQALVGQRLFVNPMFAIDVRISAEYRQTMCVDDSSTIGASLGSVVTLRQLWTMGQASVALVLGFR